MSWIDRESGALVAAYQQGHWADLFGNWLVIGGLSLAIVFWAAIAALRLHLGVKRLCAAVDRSTAELLVTPANARDFAGFYERLATALGNVPLTGQAWRDWSATLIISSDVGVPVRSSTRPYSYFSLDLLRECKINPRLHAAMPNLLVGVGLLLTFAGLAIALSAAGGIADQTVPPDVRQSGLKSLLNVASAKFATSLCGLFCSLAYTIFRGSELDRADGVFARFLGALEERIPLATPATLQADANRTLDKLLTTQSTFANDVALSIGGLLDNTFDQRLGEHIAPLREAVEKLAESIGSKSEDTLRTLVDEFRTSLQGGTQTHLETLADALARTSEGMEQIRAGLTGAADRMASAADQISEQMGRNAEQAMARITQQMEGLVGELRTLAEQSRTAGSDAMAEATRRIADAGDSFGQAARAIATSLEQGIAGITTRLSGEAEAATRRMTEQLTTAIDAMRDLAERNRSAGDEATRAMADRIGQAAQGFERSAAQVAEALTSGAGDAAGRLTAAVQELRDQFVRLTGDLAARMEVAGSQFADQGRDGANVLAAAAQAAANALRSGGEEGGESLRSGGADASRGLRAAANELDAPLRELGQRIADLQGTSLGLERSLDSMRRAASEATTPLSAVTADLVKVGTSSQKTAADLATAAQRIAPLADAVSGAMRQLTEAERRLAALSQHLDAALGGFKGLDASLGQVFKDLREGLSGFATQVTRFVSETNREMAQAVNTLNGAVTELSELYQDSRPGRAND